MSEPTPENRTPSLITTPYFSVTCETEGVNYKYSTDDSEPSQVSVDLDEQGRFQLISGSPTTIRIRAYKEGYEPSDIATKSYIPVTVPMALPDGSVLFYDRGSQYGEYCIGDDGYPRRLSSGEDDWSAESANWRYLICDKSDLEGTKVWGAYGVSEGFTGTAIGYGAPNTTAMINKYPDDTAYFWNAIGMKILTLNQPWFMPSKDELDILYDNKDTIPLLGGIALKSDHYWSSSEYNDNVNNAWYQNFSTGKQDNANKAYEYYCRLIRRI